MLNLGLIWVEGSEKDTINNIDGNYVSILAKIIALLQNIALTNIRKGIMISTYAPA